MSKYFPFTLTQLTYFAACARTLSMTQASAELHVAQSAISQAISALEKSIGAQLFIRKSARGLILTAAGESLFRSVRHVFTQLDDTVETIRAEGDEVCGTVHIACFSTLGPIVLPLLLDRLHDRYPSLVVEIFEGDHSEVLAALRQGRVELAIDYALTNVPEVEQHVVSSAQPYVVVGEKHPAAQKECIDLLDLRDEPFILLNMPSSSDYFLQILNSVGVEPVVAHRTSSFETVRSLVAAGLGYSILNQRPATDLTYSGLSVRSVEIKNPLPGLDITIAQLRGTPRTAKIQAATREIEDLLSTVFCQM